MVVAASLSLPLALLLSPPAVPQGPEWCTLSFASFEPAVLAACSLNSAYRCVAELPVLHVFLHHSVVSCGWQGEVNHQHPSSVLAA